MNALLRAFGLLLELFRGPGVTTLQLGETVLQSMSITYNRAPLSFEIESKRIIYLTRYSRPWVRDTKRAIYEVQGRVLSGDQLDINLRLKEKVVYPDLSAPGLYSTEYPHVRAISAYIDRVLPNAVVKV